MPEQTPQNTEQTNQQSTADERAQLDKYRNDLIGVHNQLKAKSDLLTALEGHGITTVTELAEKMKGSSTQSHNLALSEAEDLNTSGVENLSEVDELKAEIEELRSKNESFELQLTQQDMTIRTDRLQSQIKAEIAGKPEYSLLEKALDGNISRNILSQMQRDLQENKKFDLSHYIKTAEDNLRSFYTKLGGSVENTVTGGNVQVPGTTQQTAPAVNTPPAPAVNTPPAPAVTPEKKSVAPGGPINFPSLPSTSTGGQVSPSNPKEAYNKYLEKGRDPITGITDENRAFEAELSEFAAEGYPTA